MALPQPINVSHPGHFELKLASRKQLLQARYWQEIDVLYAGLLPELKA